MRPALYAKAKEHINNMSRAAYFYIISYPTYGGYRVEHDPTYIAYIKTTETAGTPTTGFPTWEIYLIASIAITAVFIVSVIYRIKRKGKLSEASLPPAIETL
jgi:hypothetical protein